MVMVHDSQPSVSCFVPFIILNYLPVLSANLSSFSLCKRNRLVQSCTKKCIPTDYREADLNKGESVCLDRCVSKMFEVNLKVSEKMQEVSGQRAGAAGGGGGGMGFGM